LGRVTGIWLGPFYPYWVPSFSFWAHILGGWVGKAFPGMGGFWEFGLDPSFGSPHFLGPFFPNLSIYLPTRCVGLVGNSNFQRGLNFFLLLKTLLSLFNQPSIYCGGFSPKNFQALLKGLGNPKGVRWDPLPGVHNLGVLGFCLFPPFWVYLGGFLF